MKKQDNIPMSLREIAKFLDTNHMAAKRDIKRFKKGMSELNPLYLLPIVCISLELHGREKVKKALGKKGLKALDKYLTTLEKLLQTVTVQKPNCNTLPTSSR